MYPDYRKVLLTGAAVFGFMATQALADTISPLSYTDTIAMGDSVTIRKTVVVEAAGTTSALIDAHFLIDTSGSMGDVIAGAKTAAANILASLSSFGDLASSVGVFSERADLGDAIRSPLTTNDASTVAAISSQVNLFDPDGGGDYPESGDTAVYLSSENVAWRAGSNRFIFVLSDASMKGTDEATVIASLADKNVKVIGLQFGTACISGEPGECSLTQSIAALGGTAYNATTSPDSIVAAITAGITGSLASYSTVAVSDLNAGDPMIDVTSVCVSADGAACASTTASGSWDRSVDRTFEFDVTFSRTGAGTASFATHALVDGGIVASEKDYFPDGGVSPVPLPAAGWLLIASLGGLVAAKRRKS